MPYVGHVVDVHRKLALSLNAQVVEQLRLCAEIGHPGENGRSREQVVHRFLRQLLPADVGIDTGFIIDSHGAISNQIDLVIHRRDFYPVFEVSGVRHFICESVLAVIENKSRIVSRGQLRAALANLRSAKVLDRTGGGENDVLSDSTPMGKLAEILPHPSAELFSAIITEQSISRSLYMEQLLAYCNEEPRSLWPNMYVAVHDFAGVMLHSEGGVLRPTMSTSRATLTGTTGSQGGNVIIPPLIDLAYQLSDHVRRAVRIDFSAARYFARSTEIENIVELPTSPWS